MRHQFCECSVAKPPITWKNLPKLVPLVACMILILTAVSLYDFYLHSKYMTNQSFGNTLLTPASPNPKVATKLTTDQKPPYQNTTGSNMLEGKKSCDLSVGEWVPNPEGPYYTNETCDVIQEHQNCMKFGRPDTKFLKWRWKPHGCDLPIFDPHRFLQFVGGKSIAFVGDSKARNHMESLICLLSRVAHPQDVSKSYANREYIYHDYNFNISIFSYPYLVRAEHTKPNDNTHPFKLYLDEFDNTWTNKINTFDYIIISSGQWFSRPMYFYLNGNLTSCRYCPESNITHLESANFSYRWALKTTFRALENIKGVAFLRTFVSSHFEGGAWDKGGDCIRTEPFKKNQTVLDRYVKEFFDIQIEKLKIAQKKKAEGKLRLFDTTKAMLLRPDGHPSKYGHWPVANQRIVNDCVHWCLPGPIDAWNDLFQELLEREVKSGN